MAEQTPIFLLIDGNNLAHYLYQDLQPRQKMTEEISQRLMIHLDSYSRQQEGSIGLELYLDRLPRGELEFFSSLRVFPAQYPQKADDVLIDRFWFHHVIQQPCLVVTNDEDILDEVRYAGGNSLRVFDFVRRRGINNPVFLDRADFPSLRMPRKEEKQTITFQSLRASVYFRISQDRAYQPVEKPAPQMHSPSLPPAARSAPEVLVDLPAPTLPDCVTQDIPCPGNETPPEKMPSVLSNGTARPDSSLSTQFRYQLDLEKWPVGEGIRFLKGAFCPVHRKEYQDLLSAIDYSAVTPADLRAVAELLLITCGSESDFTRHGSTMDRVRLALLFSGGLDLTLNEIADITGLKLSGLQRKIKEKGGHWLSILPQPA